MRKRKLNKVLIIATALGAVLALGSAGAQAQTKADTKAKTQAQAKKDLNLMMIQSYDLLEAGKLDEAQKIYHKVLKADPGNPLALNNLGAIMVKKGKYRAALVYLRQAKLRAKEYQVQVNRVCSMDGICLAFRPLQAVYGNQSLEPLVTLNLQMLQAKMFPAPAKY
jgi:Flp pilus assembly protein TadD